MQNIFVLNFIKNKKEITMKTAMTTGITIGTTRSNIIRK